MSLLHILLSYDLLISFISRKLYSMLLTFSVLHLNPLCTVIAAIVRPVLLTLNERPRLCSQGFLVRLRASQGWDSELPGAPCGWRGVNA